MKVIFESTVVIRIDKHRPYQKIKKEMSLKPIKSRMSKRLEGIHKQIMQFKNWRWEIHQKSAGEYLFAYVHEYENRFNRRNMRKCLD